MVPDVVGGSRLKVVSAMETEGACGSMAPKKGGYQYFSPHNVCAQREAATEWRWRLVRVVGRALGVCTSCCLCDSRTHNSISPSPPARVGVGG